jgi:hypothetical protein
MKSAEQFVRWPADLKSLHVVGCDVSESGGLLVPRSLDENLPQRSKKVIHKRLLGGRLGIHFEDMLVEPAINIRPNKRVD